MKQKTLVLSSILAVAVIGGLIFGGLNSQASTTPEQEAKYTISKYIDALKKGNVEDLMQYTEDLRFPDEAEKRKVYGNFVSDQGTEKIEILAIKKLDATKILATLRVKSKYSGTTEIEMPIVKEDNDWKILIEGKIIPQSE